MKLAIGCDHAAFEAKETLKTYLESLGHEVQDLGTHSADRCNYPDYASAVAKSVANSSDVKGILVCGSGIGVSMVANRYKGIRAALCHTKEAALLSRQHNDSNVLCLGARLNSKEELEEITKTWLEGQFEEGRHSERIALFDQLGESPC
jgi:ribose 5-phosphate isomerase B